MAHTGVRPATIWGPVVLNTYCLYMVGTSVRAFFVMLYHFPLLLLTKLCRQLCSNSKADGVHHKNTNPVHVKKARVNW